MAKLFLDDFRFPKDVYPEAEENKFDIVRSYDDFVEYIEQNGLPEFISIDNDLGFDVKRRKISLSGFDAANWLVQESGLDLTGLTFKVHSSDSNAVKKITAFLNTSIGSK
jgi:hypothetical protein